MKSATPFTGLVLATAAAGLFLSGCVMPEHSKMAGAGQVKCTSVNSCKGQSACKSTTNNCKGQNSCKGSGFVMKSSEAECKAAYDKMWGGPSGTPMPKASS